MRNKTVNIVKSYRLKAKLAQEELAKLVGVTRLTIISLEKGKYEASVGLALALAKVFGCLVEDIFAMEE